MESRRLKRRKLELFDYINYFFLALILVITVYPLYFVIIASVSDPNMVNSGQVILFPKDFTLEGYQRVFQESRIWQGYWNAIVYTVGYTVLGVVFTMAGAYALSRKDFAARNFLMGVFMVTTFFGGGLIPTYLLMSNLGMLDTIWAIILPGTVSVYNLVVVRTYIQTSIPAEIQEAARLDGCSDFGIFFKIILPLSKPIIAVIALFLAVGMWNSYFSALIYLTDEAKFPLQLILRELLVKQSMSSSITGSAANMVGQAEQAQIAEMIKYALMLVSSLPVMIIYPFVQKYFVKGIMVGSVKG